MIAFALQFPQSGDSNCTGTACVARLVAPGYLVITDDGRLGRVCRVHIGADSQLPSAFEVEAPNGTTTLLFPRELRFVFCDRSRTP